MPWGSFVNELPMWFFMLVHISAFAAAVFFARAAFAGRLAGSLVAAPVARASEA